MEATGRGVEGKETLRPSVASPNRSSIVGSIMAESCMPWSIPDWSMAEVSSMMREDSLLVVEICYALFGKDGIMLVDNRRISVLQWSAFGLLESASLMSADPAQQAHSSNRIDI